MLALLPAVAYALISAALARPGPGQDWRNRALIAALIWGATLTLITEVLSRFGQLSAAPLALAWGSVVVAAAVAVPPAVLGRPTLPRRLRLDWPEIGLLAPVALTIILTGLIAALGWPNNVDALAYHLARVAHWIQDGSVAFYPTSSVIQLYYPPWAETAILHFVLLSGDDRLANLPQWLGLVGSLVGVALIAARLGADRRGQLFALLLAATLPMGILQASSTQNDYVLTFWLVCLTACLLEWRARPQSWPPALAVGAALGLTLLTKSTGYLYAAPLSLLLIDSRFLARPRFLLQALAVGFLALAMNATHYARNLELFGTPFGPVSAGTADSVIDQQDLLVQSPSLATLASSLLRTAALHLGLPWPPASRAVEPAVIQLHNLVGLDANDPNSTWRYRPFTVYGALDQENRAGNPVQALLVYGTLVLFLLRARLRSGLAGRYALALVVGWLLFHLVLKWQPQHSRLQLPAFVLMMPLVGLAFQRWSWAQLGSGLLAVAAALPALFFNQAHPLVGRVNVFNAAPVAQYAAMVPEQYPSLSAAARFVREAACRDVGLITGWYEREYLLWVLLPDLRRGGRLEHVAIGNPSGRLESTRPPFLPCAVIDVRNTPGSTLLYRDQRFRLAWAVGPPFAAAVLLPDPTR